MTHPGDIAARQSFTGKDTRQKEIEYRGLMV